ncbi:PAS domain-containing protein [Fimbriiglobus ruber]|uniref:PAS domain-containing protein n=1 Tax=Fimbriiglobus ruber TaxID=1908690 RepID=A0A225DHL7_9BACT|nr:PAS domain-containing protein [Fimbriiglobus ruber]OWK39174.1 hypothetical protein FRUB_06256 [Fimbriiglobus ruber]
MDSPEASTLPALLEYLPEAVIAFDTRDQIVAWNRAAEALYRIPATDALGQSVLLFVPHKGLRQFTRASEAVRRSGSWSGELLATTAAGDSTFTVEARWAVAGPAGIVVAVHTDATEQRRLADLARRADRWAAVRRVCAATIDSLVAAPADEAVAGVRENLHRFVTGADPETRAGIYRGTGDWVLVGTDEPVVRELIRAVLDAAGYNVIAVADRFAAARAIADHRDQFRAAVLGFGDDTVAAAREIHRILPLLPVVAPGVDPVELDSHLGPLATALACPFDPLELIRAVAEAVAVARLVEAEWEAV